MSRAIAILRLLAGRDAAPGVQAVARELGMVPSTALHILRVLVAEGLVAFDPSSKRYRLDTGILSLARGLMGRMPFSDIVREPLGELSREWGVTAIGLQVDGLDHVVVVAISRAREPFHIHVDLGSRFPSLVSATGRCIAAFGSHDEAALRAAFRRVRWDQPPTWTEWRREVAPTRQQGYGIDRDRYIRGVTVVSAPVFAGDALRYALVAVGLTDRLRGDRPDEIGQDLARRAAAISLRLDG